MRDVPSIPDKYFGLQYHNPESTMQYRENVLTDYCTAPHALGTVKNCIRSSDNPPPCPAMPSISNKCAVRPHPGGVFLFFFSLTRFSLHFLDPNLARNFSYVSPPIRGDGFSGLGPELPPASRRRRYGVLQVYTVDHGSHISIVGGGRTRTWGAGNINVGSRWGISKAHRYV